MSMLLVAALIEPAISRMFSVVVVLLRSLEALYCEGTIFRTPSSRLWLLQHFFTPTSNEDH